MVVQLVIISVYKDGVSSQFTPPGTQQINSHTFSHHLPLSLFFLVESSNSQEYNMLKDPASAPSQTCPVMMWPLLPGVLQSGFISSTSKPKPVTSSARTNQHSWGALIFSDSDQNTANTIQKASIHRNSMWFPTYATPSLLLQQVYLTSDVQTSRQVEWQISYVQLIKSNPTD